MQTKITSQIRSRIRFKILFNVFLVFFLTSYAIDSQGCSWLYKKYLLSNIELYNSSGLNLKGMEKLNWILKNSSSNRKNTIIHDVVVNKTLEENLVKSKAESYTGLFNLEFSLQSLPIKLQKEVKLYFTDKELSIDDFNDQSFELSFPIGLLSEVEAFYDGKIGNRASFIVHDLSHTSEEINSLYYLFYKNLKQSTDFSWNKTNLSKPRSIRDHRNIIKNHKNIYNDLKKDFQQSDRLELFHFTWFQLTHEDAHWLRSKNRDAKEGEYQTTLEFFANSNKAGLIWLKSTWSDPNILQTLDFYSKLAVHRLISDGYDVSKFSRQDIFETLVEFKTYFKKNGLTEKDLGIITD